MEIVGKAKEDVSLPRATMTKIIKEMLPAHVRVTRDAQDILVECCVEILERKILSCGMKTACTKALVLTTEFINLISSEANEICYKEEKRTISPEHVLESLKVLGFGSYIREVHAAYEQHRIECWDCPKAGTKWSKEKLEMTEEEALLEQQRMFAEARERMNNGHNVPRQSQSE